jgi:large subunit ribosomal protein L29
MPEEKLRATRERLRELNDEGLESELANERRKLYDLRSRNTTKQLDNTAAIPRVKKQIARILTIQRERQGR